MWVDRLSWRPCRDYDYRSVSLLCEPKQDEWGNPDGGKLDDYVTDVAQRNLCSVTRYKYDVLRGAGGVIREPVGLGIHHCSPLSST